MSVQLHKHATCKILCQNAFIPTQQLKVKTKLAIYKMHKQMPSFAKASFYVQHAPQFLFQLTPHVRVACKRRSSVNSGAWLRRFDDVTGVEKSCVAKSKKGKIVKEKFCIIAT